MSEIAIVSTSFCKSSTLRHYAQKELGTKHALRFADGRQLAGDELRAFLMGADAAIIGRENIDDALLAALPKLKDLSLYGVGFDNVDTDACTRRGVRLHVCAGVNADAVAEHTIGLMLAARRNIALTSRLLHDGTWRKDGGHQLTGSTVAVVGCGHVGSRVARLLQAFRCRILLVDILDVSALAAEVGGIPMELESAVQTADIVTVHVPLTPVTRGMFKLERLQRMKPGSLLVNTSRGAVLPLDDLRKALEDGPLAGAALDVFEFEPMVDESLRNLPGLVGTPHIAGNAVEAVTAMGQAAVDMLRGLHD